MPKPKPFSRPSVNISSPGERKREWFDLPAEEVCGGDMVAEFGEVDFAERHDSDVLLVSTLNRSERFENGTTLRVYTYPPKSPQ